MATLFTDEQFRYQQEHYNESRTSSYVAGSIVLIVIATLSVILRFLARKSRKVALAVDDYMLVVSLALAYGLFISMIYCLRFGFGKHILRVGLEKALLAGRALYVLEAIFPACTAITKLSILLLYRRIFTMHTRWFRYSFYSILVLLMGWAIAGFFTTTFQCSPVRTAWTHVDGHCIDLKASLTGLAAINTILNSTILILPIPMVWNLQISIHKKVGICAIFALGCGDIASSIARTVITARTDMGNGNAGNLIATIPAVQNSEATSPLDITWNVADAAMLALVEPCIGILCACLPVMHTLVSPLLGGLRGVLSSRRRWSSGNRKGSDGSSEDSQLERSLQQQQMVYTGVENGKDEQMALPQLEVGGIQVRRDLEAY